MTISLFFASCPGGPEPKPAEPEPALPPVEEPTSRPTAEVFDPSSITPEVKRDTMAEVKAFIEEVNKIIRKKDYESWKKFLTPEYVSYYSDNLVLDEYSENAKIKSQGIVLKSLQDYFIYIVYPSRQSVRVDDIEFTSPVHVKAITVTPSGERLIYYSLEKVNESWKIGTGR